MKWLYSLPLVALAGCSTTPTETTVPIRENQVAGTALDLQDTENVRYSEALKAYPVGRYEDPNNPYVLHEAHTIYRAEQPPRWNLNPNAPTAVPLGPTVAVADPAKQTAALSGELEQKIQQQNQLLQATAEQNDRLSQEIDRMKTEADKAQAAAAANEALRRQVADQQAQLDVLKTQADKTPPPRKAWWELWH
ncbi:hypothetical protein SAMN05444156_0625 [Verrucomicrobium sp. GAS474]|uniref:hypothetical protein n=1 Tax=Verrucomicrobium sp. GAS474 TaxID=1882831 RepID=UPI00087B2170|nr:hypothetical protein [Verrucomicrobium sp. GAS474]SDT90706.1 hypothetical protein SAMN05444156_0625 [Verrucomicrobium sp. GAS474]